MKRTIVIKLQTNPEQHEALLLLQKKFARACNQIAVIARESLCWNDYKLHRLAYYPIREETSLGAQLVCQAIGAVCSAYKALKIKRSDKIPLISFRPTIAIPFDKRIYSFKNEKLSLYTFNGRISVPLVFGELQNNLHKQGKEKEALLVYKHKKGWYFNLVLDLPDVPLPVVAKTRTNVLGVDLGENVLAATSSGKTFSGKKLRHTSDTRLAQRRRLQRNGSRSAKKRLRKVSGKEARFIKHVNHQISKAIIKEALSLGCLFIALEDLKNIRKRIRGGKRIRTRLHRWSWHQLQLFIKYKAEAQGIQVIFVSPAYTSKLCSECGSIGVRDKHRFACKVCGIQRHSDLNASLNIRRIAVSADAATGTVNYPQCSSSNKLAISSAL